MPYCVEIGPSVADIAIFSFIKMATGVPPPCWIFEITKFYWLKWS